MYFLYYFINLRTWICILVELILSRFTHDYVNTTELLSLWYRLTTVSTKKTFTIR